MKKIISILILTTFMCHNVTFGAPDRNFILRPPFVSDKGLVQGLNKVLQEKDLVSKDETRLIKNNVTEVLEVILKDRLEPEVIKKLATNLTELLLRSKDNPNEYISNDDFRSIIITTFDNSGLDPGDFSDVYLSIAEGLRGKGIGKDVMLTVDRRFPSKPDQLVKIGYEEQIMEELSEESDAPFIPVVVQIIKEEDRFIKVSIGKWDMTLMLDRIGMYRAFIEKVKGKQCRLDNLQNVTVWTTADWKMSREYDRLIYALGNIFSDSKIAMLRQLGSYKDIVEGAFVFSVRYLPKSIEITFTEARYRFHRRTRNLYILEHTICKRVADEGLYRSFRNLFLIPKLFNPDSTIRTDSMNWSRDYEMNNTIGEEPDGFLSKLAEEAQEDFYPGLKKLRQLKAAKDAFTDANI